MPRALTPEELVERNRVSTENKRRLHALLAGNGISRQGAADLLTELTGRSVALRTIGIWLTAHDADHQKIPACPAWPATMIEKIIADALAGDLQARRLIEMAQKKSGAGRPMNLHRLA